MAYLGKGLGSLTTANITVDKMTGNGSTATLTITLAQGVNSVNDISVFVSGVMQRPGTDYTLSGSTLTFTTAPANGLQVVAVSHGDSVLDCVADATAITASFDNNSVPDSAIGSLAASKLTGALAGAATNLTSLNAAQLTGALPAVAATNLTNLTSANLTGALPALSAANLTGITSYTKSASDPAADTNPSGGTGSVWVNYTSGETYVCTDATTDANVWYNIGGGDGNIQPYTFQGSNYGYVYGGTYPTSADVQQFSFTTDGNATDVGDQSVQRQSYTASSSTTHGYCAAGATGSQNVIDKFAFASANGFTMTDVGNLSFARYNPAGMSSDGYGWCAGGNAPNNNVIDRYSHTSDGNATDWADLFYGTQAGSNGVSGITHGYCAGGNGVSDTIQKFIFASQTNGTDVANLLSGKGQSGATSSLTHGYIMGGSQAPTTKIIEKFPFASDTNSTSVGNLTNSANGLGIFQPGNASSTTHGYRAGGDDTAGGTPQDIIDKHSFSADGDATDVGDLAHVQNYLGQGSQY